MLGKASTQPLQYLQVFRCVEPCRCILTRESGRRYFEDELLHA